jgi:hypothetical protein
MDETNGLKQYHLSPKEIEAMLETQYGSSIKPVDQGKLRKLRIQQQRQATLALNFSVKDKITKQEEELEEIKSL